jgi:L-threonylcarbamoyladenylate synthase
MNIVQALANGKVVFLPSDTIYGLSVRALDRNAIGRIDLLKKRKKGKPYIILIASYEDLKAFGVELTGDQRTYLEGVWPGPVSVILPVLGSEYDYLHHGLGCLAFRMPNSPEILDIVRQVSPIVSTSANPPGQQPATSVEEARGYFGDDVDLYVDHGAISGSPSKLVSLVSGRPEILRD